MKRIAIVWLVAQLGGCVPPIVAIDLLRPTIDIFGHQSHEPAPAPCIHTLGATRDRCFAAHPSMSDEAAEGWAVEQKTRRETQRREPVVDASLPDRLDPTMIANVLATVKPDLVACRSGASGQVVVDVNVAADGRVAGVTVEQAPDAALGRCTVAAVQRARFVRTQRGGSFRYPFVF